MKAYLDNIPVKFPQPSLITPSFTLNRKDEEGFKAFSFTGDITFIGSDFDYLYSRLVTDENALENEVELKFVDECCGNIEKKFNIKSESLEWCENECSMTAAAIEKSEMETQLRCLRNTLIWDDWNGFKQKQHPRFTYCNEIRPQWHHDVIMHHGVLVGITAFTFWPIVVSIIPIIFLVKVVVDFLRNTFGVKFKQELLDFLAKFEDPGDVISEYKTWKDRVLDYMVGCGKKHPSPLVREYALNVCGKCGLGFESSIFTDPGSAYFNTCYHNAPVHKGVPLTGTDHGVSSTDYWIEKNQPILNGIKFFDQLKGEFNAEWGIKNGKVFFERSDFVQNTAPFLSLKNLPSDQYSICYSWSKKPRPAYGVFEYQTDNINTIGGEAKRRWGDIVEWNSPASKNQKGEFRPNIEFAACRFRDDGIDRDVLSFYKGAPFIGDRIKGFDRVILLNQHMCFTPMLLIWDGKDVSDARVSNMDYAPTNWENNSEAGLNQYYNYPFWFDEHLENNMYTNFWYIENPRYAGFKGKDYDATMPLTCEILTSMNGMAALDGCIETNEGIGKVNEITIDYDSKTINIKGEI